MKWSFAAALLIAGLTLCAGLAPRPSDLLDRATIGPAAEALEPLQDAETAALLKDVKVSLAEGAEKALSEAKEGIVYKVELEGDKTVHWAVDVSKGDKVLAVDVDAKTGQIVATDLENTDLSKLAKSAKVTILQAVLAAQKKTPGQAVSAVLKLVDEKPEFEVRIFAKDKVKSVRVDGLTGEVAGKKAQAKASKKGPAAGKAFTDTFPVDAADWASSGRNTYFILEPGTFQILEGKEDGKEIRITLTILNETKVVDGVETRVLEEKLFENGQVTEVARDYLAFSKKTASVYYFGEDVDNYKDGKVDNHNGSWLSGEKGAKYGLHMPGIYLLGARYQQEVAPGVGMDRAEIVALAETCETPAGKFTGCLATEETSPLEPQTKEQKLYAPGVGIVQVGAVKLVKYGTLTK